jgi:hypothetical protein
MQASVTLDVSLEVSIGLCPINKIKSDLILAKDAGELKWSHAIFIGLNKVFLFN